MTADQVYFAYQAIERDGCEVVAHAPIEPGTATPLAGAQARISAIVVTEAHVWWTTEGEPGTATGTIHRIAR